MEQERQYNLNNNVDWSTTSGQSRDYIECSNNSSRDGVLQKTPSGSFSQPAGGDVDEEGGGVSGGRAAQGTGTRAGSSDRKRRDEREANRIHCRETRERKRQKEKLLREVRALQWKSTRRMTVHLQQYLFSGVCRVCSVVHRHQ